MNHNLKAFLDMIAWSEIGSDLLKESDNGYNVLVGSTAESPLLFHDYSTHPNVYNKQTDSTAAGRYQLLHRWYVPYADMLHLHDFMPSSQDAIAIQQIKECKALPLIEAGQIPAAIGLCAHIWASLSGAGYGQHENSIDDLLDAYTAAGGELA